MKIAVYVATTAGPVRIERITGEKAPLSGVFEGRGYKPLNPISGDYDKFVQPGGPVGRAFGPFEFKSFRLDLSGQIDTGNSWELGVFIAHGLVKAGNLAAPGDDVDGAILATGQVDMDLKIAGVGHIPEKLKSAGGLFERCAKIGAPVTFYLPHSDVDGRGGEDDVKLVGVADAEQVFAELGIAMGADAPAPTEARDGGGEGRKSLSTGAAIGAIAAIVVIAALGVLAASGQFGRLIGGGDDTTVQAPGAEGADQDGAPPKSGADQTQGGEEPAETVITEAKPEKTAPPPQSRPVVTIAERRPPAGRNCADILFGKVAPILVTVTAGSASSLNGLCGLSFAIGSLPANGQWVAYLDVLAGNFLPGIDRDIAKDGTFNEVTGRQWTIDLSARMDAPFDYRVVVLTGGDSVREKAAWLRKQQDWRRAVDRLAEENIDVVSVGHRVNPR